MRHTEEGKKTVTALQFQSQRAWAGNARPTEEVSPRAWETRMGEEGRWGEEPERK